jgi:hypothetical protein
VSREAIRDGSRSAGSGGFSRQLGHALALAFKGNALGLLRLSPAIETTGSFCALGNYAGVPFGHSQASAFGRGWNGATDQVGPADLVLGNTCEIPSSSTYEVPALHCRNSVPDPRITVGVSDIDVVDDVYTVIYISSIAIPAVLAVSVPRVVTLVGCKRHPTDASKTKAHAKIADPEKCH